MQSGLRPGGHDRSPRLVLVEPPSIQSKCDDLRWSRGERDALVKLDELGQRWDGMRREILDVHVSDLVAEDEKMWCAPVEEAESDPRVVGMHERALPFDPEEIAAAGSFNHKPLRSARDEVRHDGVDGDPPARDRDPCLAGGDEDRAQAALSSSAVELERDAHLPDGAIRADGEDRGRSVLQVLP